jgi:hypothetical protein
MAMRGFCLIAFLFPLLALGAVGRAPPDPLVRLPPIEVRADQGFLDSDMSFNRVTGKVLRVVVTWIGPEGRRRGVRVGDMITNIDGRPCGELLLDEARALLNTRLKSGEARSLLFEGKRGLFGRPFMMRITFVGA